MGRYSKSILYGAIVAGIIAMGYKAYNMTERLERMQKNLNKMEQTLDETEDTLNKRLENSF